MALPSAVARMLGAKYGRRLVGDYDPEDPLGEAPPAPSYDVAVGPISINSRTPSTDGGDELAAPEEMRPPAPPVPGGAAVYDGPDKEPDSDPDDSAHLAMLATASRPAVRSAPAPDESWGTYGEAKGLSQARASDRESMLANMFQRAGRQLIGGLTRTAEADTIAAPVDAEKRYLSAQAMRREAALKALKDAREGRVADADVELKLAEADKARRLPVAPAPKPPKDDSLGQDRLALEREKWEWAKAHPRVSTPKVSAAAEARAAKSLEDVPPGFEVAEDAHPGAETRKKFTALLGSSEKMKGLTAQMREALKGTTGMQRLADPKTVTALKQLATMISIESKNVAGLGALSGPDMGLMEAIAADPTSVRANLAVDLPRMLNQLDAWGDNSVQAESRATGIRRKAAAVAAPPAAGGLVKVIDPESGLEIEVSQAAAEKIRKGAK